jgi:hypothetical protein
MMRHLDNLLSEVQILMFKLRIPKDEIHDYSDA